MVQQLVGQTGQVLAKCRSQMAATGAAAEGTGKSGSEGCTAGTSAHPAFGGSLEVSAKLGALAVQAAHLEQEAVTMKSLGAEQAAGRSGIGTPVASSSPRWRDAAVELGVEAQHALFHAADAITRASLVNGGVEPKGGAHEGRDVCAQAKMRAPAVRANGGPRSPSAGAAYVCGEAGKSEAAPGLKDAALSQQGPWGHVTVPTEDRGEGVPASSEIREGNGRRVRRGGEESCGRAEGRG